MSARHRNDGIRKICGCPHSKWPKCSHAWHFAFKWNGTHHRFSLDKELGRHIDSKSAAESEAEALRVAIKGGTFRVPLPARDTLTVAQLLETFRRDALAVRPGGVRANDRHQITAIESAVLRLPTGASRPFGAWLVADVTSAALEQYRTLRAVAQRVDRTGRGARTIGGPGAVNRALSFLRRVFNWAIRAGHVESSPFKRHGVTIVRLAKEAKRTRRLSEGEDTRLLAACGPHLRGVVEAALETGMRRGEVLGLQWRDVALLAGEIRLPGEKTKTATGRTIPISRRLAAILALRTHGPDGEPHPDTAYVFGNEIGQQVGDVKTAWRTACRRAGITDLHLHDLRREAGSRWLDAGVPLHTVRDWLGHTSVAQTSTYLATTTKTSHDAMRRFDDRRATLQDLATEGVTRHHHGSQSDIEPNEKTQQSTVGHGPH